MHIRIHVVNFCRKIERVIFLRNNIAAEKFMNRYTYSEDAVYILDVKRCETIRIFFFFKCEVTEGKLYLLSPPVLGFLGPILRNEGQKKIIITIRTCEATCMQDSSMLSRS